MSEKIYFDLTEEQRELLAPLFQQVKEAYTKGEPGLILGQIKDDIPCVAAFIPEEYGIKMNKIMHDMEKALNADHCLLQ